MSDSSAAAKALGLGQGIGTNVQVAVRCRPSNAEEKKLNQPTVITCDSENKTLKVSFGPAGKKISKNYTFDKVFGMYSTQEEVFESVVRPIVDEALAGFNCTIFAYGQTGTGKTHTMEGNIHSEEHAGIVPRSVKAILEQLEASDSEYTIRVSFLELYNEELQDLLNTSGDRKLKLCEDIKKGVVCQNLEEITVLNVGDIFEILQKGILQRQTAETLMNKNSSRSHSIFTMKIMIKECNVDGEEVVRHGQLNLVDLAGSECVGRSGAKNERAREAGSINQSLLTLGRVITALVDHHGHIPYRDSKLTRLLQESLGGKAKTVIIATLSPSQLAVEETMSTLDYAHRAKNIKNQPTVNQRMTKKVVLKEYCAEIETLKSQLQLTREKNGVYVNPEEYYAMEARIQTQESQITECEAALKVRNDEIKSLKYERDDLVDRCDESERNLCQARDMVQELTESLEAAQAELATTKSEWLAAEEVIKEQSRTESTLHSQGQGLHVEVADRRDDVTRLLEKVSRFSDSEAKRVKNALSLVGMIANSTTQLQDGITKMADESKDQSSFLSAGVSEMLTRGRDTCASLKVSIQGALATLIGDASEARDSMTSSCDTLEEHLVSTNTHVEATLKDLQGELSEWLGEVDESMKAVQALLSEQDDNLTGFSSSLLEQASYHATRNSSFIELLDADFASASEKTSTLGSELNTLFLVFSDSIIKEAEAAKEEIEAQAMSISETVQSMLTNLVTSTTQSIMNTSNITRQFSESARSKVHSGLEGIDAGRVQVNSGVNMHYKEMDVQIETNKVQQLSAISGLSDLRTGADTILGGISGDVGTKRNTLDITVSSLVGDVDLAVKKARVTVRETSDAANVILKEVVSATETMASSSTIALESFESFINKEGESVQDNLKGHFLGLSSHFDGQVEVVGSMGETSEEYGNNARDTLGSSGSTPGRSQFRPLESLVRTRDHAVIRGEYKRWREENSGDDFTIDTIHDNNSEAVSDNSLDVPVPSTIVEATVVTAIPSVVVVPVCEEEFFDGPSRMSTMSVLTNVSSQSEKSEGSMNSKSEETENTHPNKQPSVSYGISDEKRSGSGKMSKLGRPASSRSIIKNAM